MTAPFSVVIPAHDEGAVIEACLAALAPDVAAGAEVVVVCNGCTDDTADRARRACPSATVIELEEASKAAALNAGDAAATAFPRFYLDADVEVSPGALTRSAAVLARGSALAGAPEIRIESPGASWVVRAFLSVWQRNPYFGPGLIGAGLFGLTEEGRSRFERFPDAFADDLWVQEQFSPSERTTIAGAWFRPAMPATWADLWRVEVRHVRAVGDAVADGHLQPEVQRRPSGWLGGELRDPRRWPAVLVYLAVKAGVRLEARRRTRSGAATEWVKDAGSRAAAEPERSGTVDMFGFHIDPLSVVDAVYRVVDLSASDQAELVFTPNVDHVVTAQRMPALRDAYAEASLQLGDGAPVVLATRLAGRPLPARVTGSDLVPWLCQVAAEQHILVSLVGGLPEVNARAVAALRAAGVDAIGISPPFGFDADADESAELVRWMHEHRAAMTFFCVGAPRSEVWLARHRPELPAGVYVSAGAAVDFVAGDRHRAPRWIRRTGMEWLYRLAQEPGRLWRRYLVSDLRFIPLALREIVAVRRGRR